MKKEYEVRILDIKKEEIIKKLLELGAEKIAERNMKRKVYRINPKKWIRLRDNGSKITLALKEITGEEIGDVKENEIIVEDFEGTDKLLNQLGHFAYAYQENKRTSYRLGNTKFDIDEWPLIPAFLEIESDSKEEVEKAVETIGFTLDKTTTMDTDEVYEKYGHNINEYKELKF